MLAFATYIGVYLYDSRTYQQIAFFETDTPVNSIAFTPDGHLLAAGCDDGGVKLWDMAGRTEVATLGDSDWIYSVAFNSDGSLLAAGGYDGTVKLWDMASGTVVEEFAAHSSTVNSVAFSPNGTLLASCERYESTVKLWDVKSYQEIATLSGHSDSVISVAFNPDGTVLSSGSADGHVKLWNTETYKELGSLPPLSHSDAVNSVIFSSDGSLLASGSDDETVMLWDLASGKKIATFTGHSSSVYSVAFSPDDSILASLSYDNSIRLWDVETHLEVGAIRGHRNYVHSVSFSPDSKLLAGGYDDGTVRLWDVESHQEIARLEGHSEQVACVRFSPDGGILASGAMDNLVKLWDVNAHREIATLTGHSKGVMSVAFSPDGSILASGGSDGMIKLWDMASRMEIATLRAHFLGVRSVAFNPDGDILASAGMGGEVKLWNMADRKQIAMFQADQTIVYSVSFSPDGSLLATGNFESTATLWNVKDRTESATFDLGYPAIVVFVTFSPDGSILAVCSLDRDVTLWDVAGGYEIKELLGHSFIVGSASFSPDGSLLASASWDGSILLWDMIPYMPEQPNQPPSLGFSPPPPYSVRAGASINITVAAADMDGDIPVVTADALPPNAEFRDGSLTFTPSTDQVGEHLIAFTADDQRGGVDAQSITITVKALPVASDIPDQTVKEGETFTAISLDDYVSDPDNEDADITWTYNGNTELAVSISDDRVATISVPDPEWSGTETITFTATDPDGATVSDSATFTVEIVFLLGDVNNDGKIRSNDAILTLRIAAELMTPTEKQKLAADMNGDGKVRSNDAILVLREAAGLAAPARDILARAGEHITIALAEAHGTMGETVSVPLRVDSTDGLAGGDVCIAYDSSVLRAVDVLSGSHVLMASNVSEPGIVHTAFACADRLSSKTLAEIQFSILADDISPLHFRSVELYSPDALLLDSRKSDGGFVSPAMLPDHSGLLQNYPNPFNPETWIPYQLSEDAYVVIRIYMTTGQLVRTLALGHRDAGFYISKERAAYWDGRNESGEEVCSGVYFYTVQAGDFTAIEKMLNAN